MWLVSIEPADTPDHDKRIFECPVPGRDRQNSKISIVTSSNKLRSERGINFVISGAGFYDLDICVTASHIVAQLEITVRVRDV